MKRLLWVLLVMGLATAQAGVLWDQPPVPGLVALVDQEFGDTPTYSSYMANDVSVPAGGWVVNSVSAYFTDQYGTWPSGTVSVRLNVFGKTVSLPAPTDDPSAGTVYSASISSDGTITTVTLSGLSLLLGPGDYWIGLTPMLNFSPYGQEFHMLTGSILGDLTAWRNPGGGFGNGAGWSPLTVLDPEATDAALQIEGTAGVPEPSSMVLVALGLAGLAALRPRIIPPSRRR